MNNKPYKLQPLIHAATLVEERLSAELAPFGIKPRQARVLNVLHLMGSASQVELAREFDISAASMSTMATRLVAGGFIKRIVREEKGSSVQLTLTEKGRGLIGRINAAWRAVDQVMEEAIGEEKAHKLAQWSGELRDRLGGRVAGAGTGYKFYGGEEETKAAE